MVDQKRKGEMELSDQLNKKKNEVKLNEKTNINNIPPNTIYNIDKSNHKSKVYEKRKWDEILWRIAILVSVPIIAWFYFLSVPQTLVFDLQKEAWAVQPNQTIYFSVNANYRDNPTNGIFKELFYTTFEFERVDFTIQDNSQGQNNFIWDMNLNGTKFELKPSKSYKIYYMRFAGNSNNKNDSIYSLSFTPDLQINVDLGNSSVQQSSIDIKKLDFQIFASVSLYEIIVKLILITLGWIAVCALFRSTYYYIRYKDRD